MRRRLLTIIFSFTVCFLFSQTTHKLDWSEAVGTNLNLTIEKGDTVTWIWTSPNHTIENKKESTETFDSGFLNPVGSTFSHTFTLLGKNPYYCGINGAKSMSGTITVIDKLPNNGTKTKQTSDIAILQNPITTTLTIKFSKLNPSVQLDVFNVLGKRVYTTNVSNRNILTVDTNSWKSGVYLVKIATAQGSTIKRVVKL